jgi:hypothetical protein
MANRSPSSRKLLGCEPAEGIAGTYEASQDVLFDALDVSVPLSWQLGRQDQMVEDRLKQGHGTNGSRRLKYVKKKLQKNTGNARKPFEALQVMHVDLARSSPLINEANKNLARMEYPTHFKRGRGLLSIRL